MKKNFNFQFHLLHNEEHIKNLNSTIFVCLLSASVMTVYLRHVESDITNSFYIRNNSI